MTVKTSAHQPPREQPSRLDPLLEDCGAETCACSRPTTIIGYEVNGGCWHAWQVTCNTWHCPGCGPRKMHRLIHRLESAHPERFVTLTTAHRNYPSPRAAYDQTRRCLSEFAKTMRNSHGIFEYFRALEICADGYPHYHLLVRSPYIAKREISFRWCQLTSAFIVDVVRIDAKEEVRKYVTKYVAKTGPIAFTRRKLSWSRNFFPKVAPPQKADYCWAELQRFPGALEQVLRWVCPNQQWYTDQTGHHAVCAHGPHH